MDYNSHPDNWVEPQFQPTAASGQHQQYPSSRYTWGDPLTYSASQQLQQYKRQDPRKQESLSAYSLDLVYNASTQTSQNGIHESPLPGAQPIEVSPHPLSQALGEGGLQCLAEYELTICHVFQKIITGRLEDASEQLLNATEWLLGNVEDLGFHIDDVALHGNRMKIWMNLNTAWLSIFQKQIDILCSMEGIPHGRSLVSQQYIYKMGDNLTTACDRVKRHGLVDYEYGVEEGRILEGNPDASSPT
ncbi:hypothetical protein OIDMADRAFT_149788 [Oidiodendron maius Zn]|uniref:Uncharacterized protein n=1 Tax=Oidiodendron maius (strain Zn) TaxID=913774 RepID=A0A0C3GP50_OIDMZ|nr:hypothetical protein OIDMADRAFT_149788 [Oidiodendron maius Zn]